MKAQLKNLKQFRKFKTRAKFQFYVVFRPKAQKWFLPILALILLGGIMHHEHNKEYVFENPKVAAVEAIRSMPESGQTGSPVAEDTKEDATLAKQPQTKTSGSSSSTTLSPERASDVEAKIRESFLEPDIAVAVAMGESRMNPTAMNWNCRYGLVSKACKPEDRHKAWSVDCGVFQINVTGQNCPEHLLDPETNIEVAKQMHSTRGWMPWVAYKSGAYLKHL